MKSISLDELKVIQLDILSAVDKFCRENNVGYSLIGGTMLGAIRHKGYIPWDDDIDIAMKREEYNRFEKLFPKVLNGRYELISIYRNNDWMRAYPVIVDNRTIMKEEGTNERAYSVSIDLFPVDDVPDDPREFKIYQIKLKIINGIKNVKVLKLTRDRSLFKNLLLAFMKALVLCVPIRKIVHFCDKMAQANNGKGYTKCYESCYGVYGPSPFDKKVFDEYIDVSFEDRIFRRFKDYDNYLSNTYGDYMTPPPISKQVSTHTFCAYWK